MGYLSPYPPCVDSAVFLFAKSIFKTLIDGYEVWPYYCSFMRIRMKTDVNENIWTLRMYYDEAHMSKISLFMTSLL